MFDLEPSGLTSTKPKLTAINGEPTPATMTLLQLELNGNAISVASNRGGDQFGHLALTLSGADYLAVAHEAFVTPPNPGDTPIHGNAPTAHQIIESNRAFLAAKSEYKLYLAVGQALKKQLLAAVSDIFVNELAHPTLRYATVTVRNLLAHLFLTYGQITSDQLKANTTELERPREPSEPIESLWKRVQDCRAFAELGNDRISLATTVRTVLLIIEKTGVFTLDLRFFRMQAAVAQTWPALKQHFTEANTNWKRQLTTEGAGFHRANSAVNSPFAAETNPTMAEVIAAAQAATNSANAAAATITERSTTNAGPSAIANAAAYGYCWSHGLSKNRQYTSATCNHPADGHKREATLQKMMGGNNIILRPQHKPAVFVANPPR